MTLTKNYHTHTYRCGHAVGTDSDFVEAAIDFGITDLGFSDHVFLKGYDQPGMRGSYRQLDEYIASLENLRELHKDKISIHIGFEAEALAEYYDYYRELLEGGHIEYLILGNHGGFVDGKFVYHRYEEGRKVVEQYTDTLVEGVKTGLFKYIAHPDHFLIGYHHWDAVSIEATHRICMAAKEADIPLEINLAHFRSKQWDLDWIDYPYTKFWKIAKEYGCKAIAGIDAHNPLDFFTTNYDLLDEFLSRVGLEPDQNLDF